MKNLYCLLLIFILFVSCKNNLNELEEKNQLIAELNDKVAGLEVELKNCKSDNIIDSDIENTTNQLNEEKIALLEKEIEFDKNRSLTREVFFGMIEKSEFEGNIVSFTYKNSQKPILNKVSVKIEGTDNIIKFYSHLYSDYHWLYLTTNFK